MHGISPISGDRHSVGCAGGGGGVAGETRVAGCCGGGGGVAGMTGVAGGCAGGGVGCMAGVAGCCGGDGVGAGELGEAGTDGVGKLGGGGGDGITDWGGLTGTQAGLTLTGWARMAADGCSSASASTTAKRKATVGLDDAISCSVEVLDRFLGLRLRARGWSPIYRIVIVMR
jgi:hypothetical protein